MCNAALNQRRTLPGHDCPLAPRTRIKETSHSGNWHAIHALPTLAYMRISLIGPPSSHSPIFPSFQRKTVWVHSCESVKQQHGSSVADRWVLLSRPGSELAGHLFSPNPSLLFCWGEAVVAYFQALPCISAAQLYRPRRPMGHSSLPFGSHRLTWRHERQRPTMHAGGSSRKQAESRGVVARRNRGPCHWERYIFPAMQ